MAYSVNSATERKNYAQQMAKTSHKVFHQRSFWGTISFLATPSFF